MIVFYYQLNLNSCRQYAGIKEKSFFKYFKGKNKGIAIVIKDYIKFESPIDPYKVNSDFTPPQSYAYLDNILPNIHKF